MAEQVILARENAIRTAGGLPRAVWKLVADAAGERAFHRPADDETLRPAREVSRQLAMRVGPVVPDECGPRRPEIGKRRERRQEILALPSGRDQANRRAVEHRAATRPEAPPNLRGVHVRQTHEPTPDHDHATPASVGVQRTLRYTSSHCSRTAGQVQAWQVA